MKEALVSGFCTIVAGVLAALVPTILPSLLSSPENVILVRELKTSVDQSLLIDQFKDLNLKQYTKRLSVYTFENVGDHDIYNFSIEFKTEPKEVDIDIGVRLHGNFFTTDQNVQLSPTSTIISSYKRFPPNSQQDIFLLSESDFVVTDIVPNRSDIRIAWADRSLFEKASDMAVRNYIQGALWLIALISLCWTLLRILKWRATFSFEKVQK